MSESDRSRWEGVAASDDPSWYLDPLVAEQKRAVWIDLAKRAIPDRCGRLLKTDLFEDAFGEDEISSALLPLCRRLIAFDISARTVFLASRRFPAVLCFVGDVRHLPLKPGSIDTVVSLSTLDHFDDRSQFLLALRESIAVLAEGGSLGLVLDNPANPLYRPLRAMSRHRSAPFALGYTCSIEEAVRELGRMGMSEVASGYAIHNPRGLSTGLLLLLRRIFGRWSAALVRFLLKCFAFSGSLPTRRWTGCFLWIVGEKRPM